VRAGEQAGILENLLDRLATYKEKILAIKSKIKSALFYPVAIIAVAFIIVAVIMIFVIPAFKQVFTSFGADLPAPTLLVMSISDWFVAYWYIIFPAIGGAIYGFLESWKRSLAVQVFMDRLMLQAAALRRPGEEVVDRALDAHALHHVRRRRAAGGGARVGRRRCRQPRLHGGHQADPAGSLHRHLAHRRDAELGRVPVDGDPDVLDRRGNRRARRDARARSPTSTSRRSTTPWRRWLR
jgi:hypothetical protein